MMNLFFKLLGNAIYGKTAVGLSAKKVFDAREGKMKTITAGDLTNPVIVS